jgi:hypothetical protein
MTVMTNPKTPHPSRPTNPREGERQGTQSDEQRRSTQKPGTSTSNPPKRDDRSGGGSRPRSPDDSDSDTGPSAGKRGGRTSPQVEPGDPADTVDAPMEDAGE